MKMNFSSTAKFITSKNYRFEDDLNLTLLCADENFDDEIVQLEISDYKKVRDGYEINFKQNGYFIFKNIASCVSYLKTVTCLPDSVNNFIVLDNRKEVEASSVINNINFFQEIIEKITKNKISEFNSTVDKILIFLSENQGRLDLSYSHLGYEQLYFDEKFSVVLNLINNVISDNIASSIFRDVVLSLYIGNISLDRNFHEILKESRFNAIESDFHRNLNLYRSKFSFEEFINDFDKAKDSYLKEYAKFYSDLIPKIYSLPIQVGGYAFLIYKALDGKNALIAWSALLCVCFVGFFSHKLISLSKEHIIFAEKDFKSKLSKIKELTKVDLKDESQIILEKISKNNKTINQYLIFNLIVHYALVVASIVVLVKIQP